MALFLENTKVLLIRYLLKKRLEASNTILILTTVISFLRERKPYVKTDESYKTLKLLTKMKNSVISLLDLLKFTCY